LRMNDNLRESFGTCLLVLSEPLGEERREERGGGGEGEGRREEGRRGGKRVKKGEFAIKFTLRHGWWKSN